VDAVIAGLPEPDRRKAFALIRFVAEQGTPRNVQKCRHLQEKLYELKPTSQLRMPFFYGRPGQIILTHAFVKKGAKCPQSEIDYGLQWSDLVRSQLNIR